MYKYKYSYIYISLIHRHFSTWPWFFQESNVAVSVSATGLKGEAWHGYPTDTLDLSARLKSTVTLLGFSGRVSLIFWRIFNWTWWYMHQISSNQWILWGYMEVPGSWDTSRCCFSSCYANCKVLIFLSWHWGPSLPPEHVVQEIQSNMSSGCDLPLS